MTWGRLRGGGKVTEWQARRLPNVAGDALGPLRTAYESGTQQLLDVTLQMVRT